jgi:erythritol kinase (D-erythritol 1-phosphate-forming)
VVLEDGTRALHPSRRATDSASAAGAFGSFRTGGYDARVLDLLHLQEIARLLPEIVDGTKTHGELTEAAAAATALVAGTPVVLGPIDLIATALAAGLAADAGPGCSILTGGGIHIRADRTPSDLGPAYREISAVISYAGIWFKEARSPGAVTASWLLELATQLLADAGLIGIRRDELVATLEQKAGAASPGALTCHPGAWQGDRRSPAAFLGISGATTFYDLLRSIREADGRAARSCYDALGGVPEELRVTGEGAASPLARQLLAACVGAPLRVIRRATPAAAGAAMIAAVALNHYRTIEAASRDWAGPYLGDLEPVDDRLREVYARTMAGPLAAPGVVAAAGAGA